MKRYLDLLITLVGTMMMAVHLAYVQLVIITYIQVRLTAYFIMYSRLGV